MEREALRTPRIVCGLDGSGADHTVAGVAARLAADLDGEVTLVRVIEPASALRLPWRRPVLRKARGVRRELAAIADAHAFPAGTQVRVGTGGAAHALSEIACEEDAQLIVIAGPEETGLGSLLADDVPRALVGRGPCPVVMVPKSAVRPPEVGLIPAVVCGVGGDELDVELLRLAAELASRLGARLHAVHAFDPFLLAVTGPGAPSLPVELDLRAEAKRTLRNALEEAGVAAVEHVVDLPADMALRRVAGEEGAGLIVAAGRARSRLGTLVHGSVSMRLASESSTAVVVLPESG